MNNTSILLLCLCLLSCIRVEAQWLNLNPGHGGRVQGVSCYDKQPGRMFVCSDMEGFYLSNDYGENWIYRGQNVPTSLALLAQQSGNRIFYGSFEGLAYSDDDGVTWTENTGLIDNEPIGVIEVDPKNANQIYAGNQWLIQFTRKLEVTVDGSQVIYISNNKGTTWEQVAYAQGDGYRRVNSITVNPTNSNNILVASGTGLYTSPNKGGSWSKIAGPAGTDGVNETIGECMGADLTKDGKWLYAIYNRRGSSKGSNQQLRASHLFVKSYPNGAWQDLGLAGMDDKIIYWQPKVWQGDAPEGKHYVLTSQFSQGRNDGLYEGEFTVNGNTVTGSMELIFNFNKFGRGISTDAGWNQYVVNQSRNKVYWPANWSGTWNSRDNGQVTYERGVLTMSQQSFFVGDATNPDSWDIQSCSAIDQLPSGVTTYHTNGTQSTFTYDVAIYNNYAVMGQADNGTLESYDYGYSWTQLNTPTQQDAHSFLVIPGDKPLLIASIAFGWGGGNPGGNAEMAYKYITDTNDQVDEWTDFISGKQDEAGRKGLPAVRSWIMLSDPQSPYRVYCGTQKGVFVTEDIRTLIDSDDANDKNFYEAWGALGGIANQNLPVNDMSFDPTDSNVIFVKCQNGNLKLTRESNGNYTWEQGIDINGKSNYFSAQGNTEGGVETTIVGGNVLTLTTRNNPEMGNNLRRHDIYVAVNGSNTYVQALYWKDAMATLGEPDWFIPTEHDFQIGDFSVHGNKIYIPYHVWQLTRKGFGVVEGTINSDGSISDLKNFGADGSDHEVEYTVAQRTRVYTDDNNVTRFYMATSGGGLTAKIISGNTQTPTNILPSVVITSPSANESFKAGDDVQIRATASDADGSITKVEFYNGSTKLGEDTVAPYQYDLKNVAEGSYSIKAKATDNKGGIKTVSINITVNPKGGGGGTGSSPNDCSATSGGGKPNPPCNAWAEITSPTSVTLHWNDNSDNEDYFDIQAQLDGASFKAAGMPDGNQDATSVNITGLVEGAKYTFRVKSFNANGGSAWALTEEIDLSGDGDNTDDSDNGGVTPNPEGNGDCSATSPAGKPNPPCGVWVEVTSSTSVVLHWNDNSDNEDYFDIQAQKPGESFKAAGMPDGAKNANSVSITGLNEGTEYTFRIKSFNSLGGSSWVTADQVSLGSGARKAIRLEEPLELTVYPIPSNGLLKVRSNTAGHGVLINMVGQVIQNVKWVEGVSELSLNVKAGMYMLISNDKKIKKQIIIQK